MKTARLGLAALLFAGIACAEEFDLVDYSPKKGTVWIKTATGQDKRPFDSFSAEDQQKITGWLADKGFSAGLTINIDKTESRTETKDGEIKYVSYAIELENNSEATVNNIGATYRIFYEKEKPYLDKEASIAEISRTNLMPGEKRIIKTPAIPIRDERTILGGGGAGMNMPSFTTSSGTTIGGGVSTPSGTVTYNKDRLLGIYLCVSRRDRDGKTIKRESEVGQVPETDKWKEYRTQSAPVSTQSAAKTDVGTLIARAEDGDYKSAYSLCQLFSKIGDQEKTKEWTNKTRELISKSSPNDPMAAKILSSLDQLSAPTRTGTTK